MSTQLISTINNQKIVIVIDEEGQKFVPIKPICEALGVNYTSQLEKLENDDLLDSTIPLRGTVGADGKTREMKCIPLEFVFGWVFSISSKNVKDEVRESLIQYKKICHRALFDYFTEHSSFIEEKEKKLNEYVDKEAEARNHFKNAEKLLKEIRTERDVFRKTTFEEWKANNNQLMMDFKE
ncbi:phage antirepressor N-terminal domain-containing protein [Flavobacterium sp. GT2N3]|uniref:phage antirepressor N-terminal domain-containing protein n=1 Tax=unclassified Flavobacterium TaxID=196869 RepID=UPI003AAE65A4